MNLNYLITFFSEMSTNKEIIGLIYACEYLYFVVGNYLIEPHELLVHHVSINRIIFGNAPLQFDHWLLIVLFGL